MALRWTGTHIARRPRSSRPSSVASPIGISRALPTAARWTASTSATQNVVTAANRAGLHVDNMVYEALMSADSTLRADEKELGVCLADMARDLQT